MSQSQYHNAQSVDWHVVAVALVAVDLLDETHKRNGCMMVVADTCSDWPLGSSTSYKKNQVRTASGNRHLPETSRRASHWSITLLRNLIERQH